jgi:beta-carotene ketolase (CrtO type)
VIVNSSQKDAIVVGAGHNGLTCAAYLARAGRRVLVLEADATVGGLCRTAETVAEAPGFKMNTGAIDHILTNPPVSVADDLGLAHCGLRYIEIDPLLSYLPLDGGALPFWTDLDRTVAEIRRLSPKDAERYRQLTEAMIAALEVMVPYMQGHPRQIAPRHALQMVRKLARGRGKLATAARVLGPSPITTVEEWFEREEVKTALLVYATTSLVSVEGAGGLGMLFMAMMHRWGLRRPIGGSGEFTRALAEFVTAHGGEIRTSSKVREIIIRDGRAAGVHLDTGEQLFADDVVGAVDPITLMKHLVDPANWPERTRDELNGLQLNQHNIGTFKIDIALSARPAWPTHGDDARVLSQVMLVKDVAAVREMTAAAASGELLEDPPIWSWNPAVFDRTIVPSESEGDSLYIYVWSPVKLSRGRDWAQEKDAHFERCMTVLERYSPGIRSLVIGANVETPADFARKVHNACIYHADITPWQMGPWRPTPSTSGYRTPIEGLWHIGAGAHPSPGVCGWSGRTAARMIVNQDRRPRELLSSTAASLRRRARQPTAAPAPSPNGRAPAVNDRDRTRVGV